MAQWQYKTFCTELSGSVDLDDELRKILQDYGMKGWELVQVLPGPGGPEQLVAYLKREKA